jgi:hypothetical protein
MRSPNGPARRRTTHLRFRGSQHVESSRTSLRTPESCLLSLSSDRWCHDMRAEAEIDGDGDAAYQERRKRRSSNCGRAGVLVVRRRETAATMLSKRIDRGGCRGVVCGSQAARIPLPLYRRAVRTVGAEAR